MDHPWPQEVQITEVPLYYLYYITMIIFSGGRESFVSLEYKPPDYSNLYKIHLFSYLATTVIDVR